MTKGAILRLIAEINDDLEALAHIQGCVRRAQARFAAASSDEFELGGIAIDLRSSAVQGLLACKGSPSCPNPPISSMPGLLN